MSPNTGHPGTNPRATTTQSLPSQAGLLAHGSDGARLTRSHGEGASSDDVYRSTCTPFQNATMPRIFSAASMGSG